MKRIFTLLAICATTVLSGCATSFSSQVSTFQEWPASPQKSYIFERAPAQENNPEYKLYEDQLRIQLGMQGFQEISGAADPALKIGMQFATTLAEIQYPWPWHPAMYDPFWDLHFRHAYYFGRYPYFGPRWRGGDMSLRATYLHQLQILISDYRSNKRLADIRVSSEQLNPRISEFMPLMIQSALLNFPGKNGSTVEVEIPLDNKSAIKVSPVSGMAAPAGASQPAPAAQ